jgi:hypothetical protein
MSSACPRKRHFNQPSIGCRIRGTHEHMDARLRGHDEEGPSTLFLTPMQEPPVYPPKSRLAAPLDSGRLSGKPLQRIRRRGPGVPDNPRWTQANERERPRAIGAGRPS